MASTGGKKNFEEFRSASRRRETAQRLAVRQRKAKKAGEEAGAGGAGGKDVDAAAAEDAEPVVPHLPSFTERIGAFVESPELQFIVTIFIGLDLLGATLELLIDGGMFGKGQYASMLSHASKFLDYSSVFMQLMFTLELMLLVFAFGMRILGHIGYTADFIVVGTNFYALIVFDSKGAVYMDVATLDMVVGREGCKVARWWNGLALRGSSSTCMGPGKVGPCVRVNLLVGLLCTRVEHTGAQDRLL